MSSRSRPALSCERERPAGQLVLLSSATMLISSGPKLSARLSTWSIATTPFASSSRRVERPFSGYPVRRDNNGERAALSPFVADWGVASWRSRDAGAALRRQRPLSRETGPPALVLRHAASMLASLGLMWKPTGLPSALSRICMYYVMHVCCV